MSKNLIGRVHLLDELRGFAIICMVFYHAMYDLVVLFRIDFPLFTSPVMQDFLQPLFAGLFIMISGAVGHYSRSNVKRGLICFLFGLALTAGTFFVMPRAFIAFGILHFLGIAMMLFPLFKKLADKMPPVVGIAAGFLLFWFFCRITEGQIGLAPLFSLQLPKELYSTPFLFWLGFPGPGFFSSDYFSLIPWLFVFFSGVCFGRLLKEHRCPAWFYKLHIRPLAFVGRHTVWVYLLHQPVCYGLMLVLFWIFG